MAKQIMVLCGSPRQHGNTNTVVAWVIQGATDAGARIDRVDAARLKYKVNGCISCFACQKLPEFECVVDDDAQPVLARIRGQTWWCSPRRCTSSARRRRSSCCWTACIRCTSSPTTRSNARSPGRNWPWWPPPPTARRRAGRHGTGLRGHREFRRRQGAAIPAGAPRPQGPERDRPERRTARESNRVRPATGSFVA